VRGRILDGWIFGPGTDLLAFLGPPAAAAGLVLLAGDRAGEPLAPWAFLLLVVACDVGHVWTTLFRTYLDPEERARRGALLAGVPLAALVVGVLLALADGTGALFWRCLAYLAAFHFVRQQRGWMAWSGRKAGRSGRGDRLLDDAAVYAATVYPLVWWHAHLPRSFAWFRQGDFAGGVPAGADDAAHALHAAILGAWALRQAALGLAGRGWNPAQWLVLGSTWITWYGGIVLLDSDLAFTASNCLSHGVPYFLLVHRWGARRFAGADGPVARLFRPGAAAAAGFLAAPVLLAFVEEAAWDRLVWHEHALLFPFPAVEAGDAALAIAVPLLAVPQATHYVLDAFLWRTGAANPRLAERMGIPAA
jgi:hypothetical protein